MSERDEIAERIYVRHLHDMGHHSFQDYALGAYIAADALLAAREEADPAAARTRLRQERLDQREVERREEAERARGKGRKHA